MPLRRFAAVWLFLLAGATALPSLFLRPPAEPSPPSSAPGPAASVRQTSPEGGSLPAVRVVRVPVADVRAEPDPAAELVTQALYGTEVRAVGRRDGWLRVVIPAQGDYPGYIREEDLTPAGPPFLTGPQAWVVSARAAVRAGPGEGFPALVQVYMFTRLPLAREERGWLRVRLPGGGAGWLPGEAAVAVRPGSLPAPAAEAVLRAAERLRGAPYLWGGMTVEGIDCSALTHIAFGLQGIVLPRDADRQQFDGPGFPVDRRDLRAGDLVFFSGNRRFATHVGIYRGDGTFVHAAPRTAGVAVSALGEPYWDRLYFGARRVLP